MAKFKCGVCGFIFDEEKEDVPFSELTVCPVCRQPVRVFEREGETEEKKEHEIPSVEKNVDPLAYPPEFYRKDDSCRYMEEIHQMAVSGKPIIEAMGTKMPMPCWDDILLLGAQLNPPPLDEHAPVSIKTVIGKNAERPMVLEGPVSLHIPYVVWSIIQGDKDCAVQRLCNGRDSHVQRRGRHSSGRDGGST